MCETKLSWHRRFAAGLRHAFSLKTPHGPLTDEDRALMERLADAIVRRRMATPAVLFLQSVKPLNALGSQAMVFLRPFVAGLFRPEKYDRLTAILERRDGIEMLLAAIEAAQAKEPAK